MDQIPPGLNLDLCMFPAGIPPNGTLPNFDDPETLAPVLVSISVIMTIGAVLFTTCRLFANRRKFGWGDCLVAIALILSLGNIGLMLSQLKYARHQWDIRACWFDGRYIKIIFSSQIVYTFALFFSKLSILLLFYRIFQVERTMRIAIRLGIAFSALFYITNIPVSAFISAPHVGETWDSVVFSGRLEKDLIWGVVQAVLGTLLDLFIFVLPIPVVLKLNLSRKKKLQVLAVFTTGFVGVIASVLSLVYRVDAMDTNDGMWKYTSLVICSVVENNIAIIISCTPGFSNFMRIYMSELRVIKLLFSTFNRSGSDISEFMKELHKNDKENPNRPRTGGRQRRRENHELSDTFSSVSLSERGELERIPPQPTRTMGPNEIGSQPPGVQGNPYRECHGPGADKSVNYPSQTSTDDLAIQRPD